MIRTLITLLALFGMFSQLTGCFALVATGAATGAVVAHDRRTAGTILEDQSIELKAYKMIGDLSSQDEGNHISAISYNNNVLLIGQTTNPRLKQGVEDKIKLIPKVRQIYNEIQIAAPTSMMTRSSDSWITTKIKSEMLVSSELDPTRAKVVTEDGVVYLMGIVRPYEEQEAVEVARRTRGVKKVIKMFEHITDDEMRIREST